MKRVLHVLEGDLPFGLLRTVQQVIERLPAEQFRQMSDILLPGGPIGAISARRDSHIAAAGRSYRAEAGFRRVSRLLGLPVLRGMSIRGTVRADRPDVIHAWGLQAGAAVASANPQVPIVLSVDMEHIRDKQARRWLAALREEPSIRTICPAECVRRRLLENGFPPASCVTIRPGVDLSGINAAKERFSRTSLGLNGEGPVLLTPGPPHRGEGQYLVLWAAALLQQLPTMKTIRVVVPGDSPELERLRRFTAGFQQPHILVPTGSRYTWEELLSVANAVVAAAETDISTTGLAWAMGAGVPIVGAAIPSVAEALADRHSALLCKPGDPRLLAGRILTLLEDGGLRAGMKDAARGIAFEVFGVRRCVDQHEAVYDNVLAGRPIGSGIADSASIT
jgi:glycosyltransferase involved in cell wall biosynthesis